MRRRDRRDDRDFGSNQARELVDLAGVVQSPIIE